MKALGLLGLGFLALAACSDRPTPLAPDLGPAPAVASASRGAAIDGSYIVVFRGGADVDGESSRLAAKLGGKVTRRYRAALHGMAIQLPAAAAAALANEPSVASVEQDRVVSIATTQTGATWGLDRVDQRESKQTGIYVYNADGTGVTVYIIDSGINLTHLDFDGRAVTGIDVVTPGGTASDCYGHGTHVSGTVGGEQYGIAKKVQLVAVRVLGCDGLGTTSGVIAGVDWVTANRRLPAAANMSLQGGLSPSLNQAVANSIASGVVYGVAAGNSTADACNVSPASVPDAITVGATDWIDTFASFSNYGGCVDINAPGVNITSTGLHFNWSTEIRSGTSMATPHVVGAAALYLQVHPSATPSEVASALTGNATANVISGLPGGTPNLLLYTGFISATPSPLSPVASFTFTCVGLSCHFDGGGSTALSTATYSWSYGDASTGSGAASSHAYASAGAYSVVLTVADANGSGTRTHLVTVPPAPVASFTYSCSKRTCTFDASATTDATDWQWNFSDESYGRGEIVSHTFAPHREYSVALTADGPGGRTMIWKPVRCFKRGCQ